MQINVYLLRLKIVHNFGKRGKIQLRFCFVVIALRNMTRLIMQMIRAIREAILIECR